MNTEEAAKGGKKPRQRNRKSKAQGGEESPPEPITTGGPVGPTGDLPEALGRLTVNPGAENPAPQAAVTQTKQKQPKRNKPKPPGKPDEGEESPPEPTTSGEPSRPTRDLPQTFGKLNVNPDAENPAPQSGVKQPKKPKQPKPKLPGKPGGSDLAEEFSLAEKEIQEKEDRRKENSEESFAKFEKLTGLSLRRPPKALIVRPDFPSGQAGRKVDLHSNFFKLKLNRNFVYQYRVVFLQLKENNAQEHEVGRRFKRITKRLHQDLLLHFVNTTGRELFEEVSYAYDNENTLITNKEIRGIPDGNVLPFSRVEPRDDNPNHLENYLIKIKPTIRVALNFDRDADNSRSVAQTIDIICKTYAFQKYIVYGSKIFLPTDIRPRIDIEGFRGSSTPFELALGYHQSTRFCEGGVMLNIDQATAVLFKGGPLIKSMCQLLGFDSPDTMNNRFDARRVEALDELTHLRVETNYRGYPCFVTIKSFSKIPCSDCSFTDGESRRSVVNYFREQYGINLRYTSLPCIVYGKGHFLPVELCDLLPNQRNQRKLRDELIRIVSNHTKKTPNVRSEGSCDIARRVAGQLAQNQFNIGLDYNRVKVTGRVLSSPRLAYSNDTNFTPSQGDWNMAKEDKTMRRFLAPKELKSWALISLESRKIDKMIAERFTQLLQKNGRMLGMEIALPKNPFKIYLKKDLETFFKFCKDKNLQLIVVMMPENVELYSAVKKYGDQDLGVPTQVILDKHYDSRGQRHKLFDTAYICNLLLKINVKVGGTNLKLSETTRCSILGDKTMVVGIDVNHPSPGEKTRSIAAVVGSIDKEFSKYRTEIMANRERDELVQVDEMLKSIIEKFKLTNGYYPNQILVYRDGVSEGQFSQVMAYEILPVHKYLQKLPGPPNLTYMIVQKRHNARFVPMDARKDATRSGNMLPGTVIDKDVVHFKWFDFYLCSQNSFLGMARPGKYTVLWNSSGASADDLQMATYYLCYLFARATKSIADPAPARYAHHAAARGKVHYREIAKNRDWTEEKIQAEINNAINVTENYKNVLYFI